MKDGVERNAEGKGVYGEEIYGEERRHGAESGADKGVRGKEGGEKRGETEEMIG